MVKKKRATLEILEIMILTVQCSLPHAAAIVDSSSWTLRLVLPRVILLQKAWI